MAKEKTSGPPMTVKELASMGGNARAESLSAERRKEIADKAIAARWGNKVKTEKPASSAVKPVKKLVKTKPSK